MPRSTGWDSINLMSEVTPTPVRAGPGDSRSGEELLPILYEELRRLAATRMAHEAAGQTLQPTALVHEAWIRLAGTRDPVWQNRGHFFAAAAEAMRRILIDRARGKQALKRGAGAVPIDLDRMDVALESAPDATLRVNEALEKLAGVDAQAAELVKLRFFIGLDYVSASEAMGISERSAKRCWDFARAWLYRELSRSDAG